MSRYRTVSLVALLAALLMVGTAAAQTPVTFGVTGGVNVATVTIDDPEFPNQPKSMAGVVAGVFFGTPTSKPAALMIEALYSRKGTRIDDVLTDNNGQVADLAVDVDYFEIPVLGRFTFGRNSRMSGFGLAGVALAFRMNDTQKLGGVKLEGDARAPLKSYDTGLTFGGGLEIDKVLIELRYTFGLVDVNDALDTSSTAKNRAWTIKAGYRFW
jgi:opacity protein-like surface antigen